MLAEGRSVRLPLRTDLGVIAPLLEAVHRGDYESSPLRPDVGVLRRLLLFYKMQMAMASQPADVARVIHHAVTTAEPKLRYLVGEDAKRLVAGRARLTDEEYVETGRPMPDEEYLDLMRRRYEFDW